MQDQHNAGGNVTPLHPRNRSVLTESLLSHRERRRPTVDLTLLAELYKEHYLADGDQDDGRSIVAKYWGWLEAHAPDVLDEVPPMLVIESLAVAGQPLQAKQPTAALIAIASVYLDRYCPPEYSIERGDPVASGWMEWLRKRRPLADLGTTQQRLTAIICAEARKLQREHESS